jgi:hypothetical protein
MTMLEQFPTIEQCDSQERDALPVSATLRACFRELKTSSPRRMTLPLLQLSRHFLMIIAVITARAQCREISIGKMRSLDDEARRV